MFKGLYKFPEDRKKEVRKVLGVLFKANEVDSLINLLRSVRLSGKYIASVGDRVTYTLVKNEFIPDIAVIDGLEMRKKAPEIPLKFFNRVIQIYNPPGHINFKMIDLIRRYWLERPMLFYVIGEEDLLGFPIVLTLKYGSYFIYGLPMKGIVAVEINEATRKKAIELLA